MRLAILTAALLALLPASAPAADLVIDGRGWGHGVGMSQYGAYGYALREGRDYRFILAHYYTGTTFGRRAGSRMRVRLKRAPRAAAQRRDARRAPPTAAACGWPSAASTASCRCSATGSR